jgi:hypothetical protein
LIIICEEIDMHETITNQTVAVTVLAMILGGLAWITKQLFALAPTVLDRLDKQEEKRAEVMEKLAERLEKAIDRMGDRVERALSEILEDVSDCVEDCVERAQRPSNGKINKEDVA